MEKSSFFNSVMNGNRPDRVYLAEDFARYFNSFIGNGVFPNPSTSLQVMANDDMTVTLKAGKGWINGYFYVNTDDLVIPIEMADGLRHRIDRIVLRLDLNNRWVKTAVKKGNLSTDPVPPGLQRGDNIYELGLAEVRVGKGDISISQSQIKDTRASNGLCGWVTGVVDQVDTETLFRQYEKWFEETTGHADATLTDLFEKYEKWYKDTTGKAETDLTEIKENFKKDLEEFTDNYTDWFINFTGESEREFNEWFESIKDVIDDNVATKLFEEIKRVEGLIDDIPPVFHDLPQNAVKESMAPRDFEYGVTLCSQSSVDDFPSVNEYGVSYTLIGRNSNYAQIFITRFGDIWSRRSTVRTGWNGDWYSNKKEIEKKADKKDIRRTSTIIIANYDSHENSKQGADIIIDKGENASEKIQTAIDSLGSSGGEIKLMEGEYQIKSVINLNSHNTHLSGIPGSTILKYIEGNDGQALILKVLNNNIVSNITFDISKNIMDGNFEAVHIYSNSIFDGNYIISNGKQGGVRGHDKSIITHNVLINLNRGIGVAPFNFKGVVAYNILNGSKLSDGPDGQFLYNVS